MMKGEKMPPTLRVQRQGPGEKITHENTSIITYPLYTLQGGVFIG